VSQPPSPISTVVAPREARVVVACAIAVVAPLALLLANSDWFFTREGYLDPWNYVGLFQQYLDPDYLPEDYKLGRLPWILAGFLVHSALPPVAAAYLLHAVFLAAMSFALFVGLYVSFGRPALAAVVTLWLGFYAPAHGSGGWDYHNTAAGAFYLATFALLALRSTLDGSRVMLVSAGAAAALAIHTNVTFVNFLPVLAFVYVWNVKLRSGSWPRARQLLERAAWSVLGAVLITVVLGLLNWNVGRRFWFFTTLLDAVLRFVGDSRNVEMFYQPWTSGWIWTARYLALTLAVFVAGVAFVARYWRAASDRPVLAFVLQFLVMTLVWVAWQAAGQITLNVDYFAYALIPSCFIALAGMLSHRWPDWCERHWPATVLGTALCLVICLTVDRIPGAHAVAVFVAPVSFIAIGILFLLGFAIVLWRPAVASVAILLATFAFGNRLVAGPQDYLLSDSCKVQPSVYAAVVDAASWLMTEVDPLYTRARIWFDEDEILQPLDGCPIRLGYMANSIATMASMAYVTRPFPMPGVKEVPDTVLEALARDGRILTLISRRSEPLDAWKTRFERLALAPEEIARHRVGVLSSEFTLYAWTVAPIAR
jgi:hypothetical protein